MGWCASPGPLAGRPLALPPKDTIPSPPCDNREAILRRLFTGALLLALAGCVEPVHMRAPPGMSQAEADRDSAACRNEARAIGQNTHSMIRDQRMADIFRDCMIVRGHTANR